MRIDFQRHLLNVKNIVLKDDSKDGVDHQVLLHFMLSSNGIFNSKDDAGSYFLILSLSFSLFSVFSF